MKKVVYSGPPEKTPLVKKLLGKHFDVSAVLPTPESVYPEFHACSVFLDASMKVPITGQVINTANLLELVITATTGATHIDIEALKSKGVPLMTLADQKQKIKGITAAAEHSWLLLMSCARRLRGGIRHVEQGSWSRELFPGIMLRGKTLGIIGLGRIGSWMSRYAGAFEMKVIGFDPYQTNLPDGIQQATLDEIFEKSDFITLHVAFSEKNRGMISQKLINKSKTGCVFINTSRSELVDEDALVAALEKGILSAVGTDVLWGEPEISQSPLWRYATTHDNVLITPHIGGFCPEAVDIVLDLSCRRILAHFGIVDP